MGVRHVIGGEETEVEIGGCSNALGGFLLPFIDRMCELPALEFGHFFGAPECSVCGMYNNLDFVT